MSGPHFLIDPANLVGSDAPSPTASEESPLRAVDPYDALAERINRPACDNCADQSARLAELDDAVLRLSAGAANGEPCDGVSPRMLAEAAVRDWRRLARSLSLSECRSECNDLLLRLLDGEAAACSQASAVDVSQLFRAWLRAGSLAREALTHGPAAGEIVKRLALARESQQAALQRALVDAPLDDSQRQRYVNDLVDASEAVLTAAEDLPPEIAAAQMDSIAADIAWCLEHVEAPRRAGRRRLRREHARLLAESQERLLQGRLEARFGRANLARFDQLVLGLIVMVFVLLFLETAVHLSPHQLFAVHLADTAICCVFLWDFGVRLWLAPHRGRWFRRHFLIDLVPSLPYGLLLSGLQTASAADLVQLGRVVRLLRVQPLIRMFRAFGFLTRGLDRLARRFAPMLNRSVILYPTRAERASSVSDGQHAGQRVRELHLDVQDRWKQLVLAAPVDERPALAHARLQALHIGTELDACDQGSGLAQRASVAREVPAEVVLRRLGGMTPRDVQGELGGELAGRLARVVRIFSRPPLCWFPLIRSAAPRIGPWMSDSHVVSAAARQLAVVLKAYHDRWFWFADLHGAVTPSVFVDRLGTMLVKSSFRPAYRLALFGTIYMVVYAVVRLVPFEFLSRAEKFLETFVGPAILLLGGICCVVFSLGWWLKRLASEATEFYEQAAEAQFLSLTEIIRSRRLQRDALVFHHRVLKPEWRQEARFQHLDEEAQIASFVERVRGSLLGTASAPNGTAAFDKLDRVVLLYRDSLDGALFVDSDNRTTCQLLGNPAIRQFLLSSLRIGRKQVKALRFLDLERKKALFSGPYLWFNFISRAVAHSVASLIVDYNRHAIPLAELPLVPAVNRRRYDRWLHTRSATNAMPDDTPASTDERTYVTTAFTALHFLDFDSERDSEVEARFGPEVLARLRRDRSLGIRRVFGTYPWNLQPREQRILNLYALYERWLSGGRALLLPLFVLIGGMRRAWNVAGWICRAVNEIRRPELRIDRTGDVEADFATAVRKIARMRGPVVYASLRLRAAMDPEYLGVAVPGATSSGLEGADVQSDLAFLDAEPWVTERVEQDRRRAVADMRRLGQLFDEGLLARAAASLGLSPGAFDTPAHRRAAAVAYLADFRGLRRLLSAKEIIAEVFDRAPLEPPQPNNGGTPWGVKHAFHRYCREQHIEKHDLRAACWWATQQNLWGVADAIRVWNRQAETARAQGEAILAEILRHPGRITEQLVTLRAIQTLAILDVLNYRQHVYELGQYAAAGDPHDELLDWNTCGVSK